MRLLRTQLIAAAYLTVLGCASVTEPEEVRSTAQAQIPPLPQDFSPTAEAGVVEVNWIESFNDATLESLVQEAQSNNRDLQAAAANVERAWALAAQAGAALTPNVSIAGNATRSGSVEGSASSTGALDLGVQVNWEVDLWGRVRSGQQAAVASAEAAEADYLFTQYSLAAAIAKGYFISIEAGLQESVARETVTALEETMRIVNARYTEGLASAQDRALTRSDLATARERLIAVEGSRRDAIRALEVLLGRYPAAELDVRPSLPEVPPPPPAGVPSELLERRPDIVAAERRVAAAFNSLDQARAARLPTVGLTSTIGGTSNALSSLLDPANLAWTIGTSLLTPIFDGGATQAQVDVATAEQQQALAAFGQAALGAFSEVESNLDLGGVLTQQLNLLNEAAQEASEAYRIAQARYREGETDLLDVLTIQQRVLTADTNRVSVQRSLLEQRVNLHLALGGSWTE